MDCRMHKSIKGQSLVETALVLPIILLILMGIIDFGMVFNNYIIISNASREGARYAAAGSNDTSVAALIENDAATLDQSQLTITIAPDQYNRNKGDEVDVTVEYNYKLLTPIISAIIPGPIHLTGRSAMRVE